MPHSISIPQVVACLLAAFVPLFGGLSAQDPPKALPVADAPLLKPGDAILMEVFGEPELTTSAKIDKAGSVTFQLIGAVKIAGKTVGEAIDRVTALYAADYLRNPKVRISVEGYAEQYFSVLGAVNGAGQFAMPPDGKLDLGAAIATAGGLNEVADRRKIVLTRADGRTSTFTADQAENGSRVAVGPGDRIIVHTSDFVGKTVTLLGQVRKPGPHPMPLDGKLDIVSAIASAGGFTELANPKKVSINRGGRVTLLDVREMTEKGNRGFFLQADDIVTVEERIW